MPQKILITGGSRGIGAAAVQAFAKNGDDVAFVWHSNSEAAEKVLRSAAACAPHGRFLALRADVSDSAQITEAVREAEETLGAIDVLVCNAGIAQQKLFTDLTDEVGAGSWVWIWMGRFIPAVPVLPGMIHRKYGRILLVSSMWGQTGASCEVHYSAAKAGVIGPLQGPCQGGGPFRHHGQLHCTGCHRYRYEGPAFPRKTGCSRGGNPGRASGQRRGDRQNTGVSCLTGCRIHYRTGHWSKRRPGYLSVCHRSASKR